jgi:Ca2+-binding EF-hand superfamily protein
MEGGAETISGEEIALLREHLRHLPLPKVLHALFAVNGYLVHAEDFIAIVGGLLPAESATALRFLFDVLSHSIEAAPMESIGAAGGAATPVLTRRVLTAALSTLCEGDHLDITRSVFQSFDTDRNGTLERGEVRHYLDAVFRTTLRLNVAPGERVALADAGAHSTKADAAAEHFAARMFATIDADASGAISQDEFRSWLDGANAAGASTAGATSAKPGGGGAPVSIVVPPPRPPRASVHSPPPVPPPQKPKTPRGGLPALPDVAAASPDAPPILPPPTPPPQPPPRKPAGQHPEIDAAVSAAMEAEAPAAQ